MKNVRLFLIIFCALLSSCVTLPVPPLQGGEKDTTPPLLIKTTYHNDKVVLHFDENIIISEKSQIISNMFPEPEYEVKRNKLIIKKVNNTDKKQIIRFNGVIKDLNENNSLSNYSYINNVGPDTFGITGQVQTLFKKKKKISNCYIILTDNPLDIDIQADLYNYDFTKTNINGDYDLSFIPNPIGKSIVSFMDVNNNFKLDKGDYFDVKKIDSSNQINFTLSYNNPNVLRIDTLSNNSIKTTLHDANLFRLKNNTDIYKYKINTDSLFSFKNVEDSLILSQTNNLFISNSIDVLSSYIPKLNIDYSSAEIENNKLIRIKENQLDTIVVITNSNNDTLQSLSLIADNKLSTLRFISNDSNTLDSIYGFIYDKNSFYTIVKGKLNYKNKLLLSPFLSQGQYNLFLFKDMNGNSVFDFSDLNSLREGDRVLKNLEVIDIGAKMDVEVSVQP